MIVSAREALSVLLAMGGKKQVREQPSVDFREDEIGKYKALVAAAPALREERLSALKTALQGESYRINDYEVAAKIFERYLVDSLCARTR